MIVGIDASRCRSGGGMAHLVGILENLDPVEHDISKVHLWTYISFSKKLPSYHWLEKHTPDLLEYSLILQLWWQRVSLSKALKQTQCDILFTVDSSTVCRFKPMVVLNQDLLSYDPENIRKYRMGYDYLRIIALRYIQKVAFNHAVGVIFLTKYAAEIIQKQSGKIINIKIIPHGVDDMFKRIKHNIQWPEQGERSIRCLYISNALPYKNIEKVIRAIEIIRGSYIDVVLELVGGGCGEAQERVEQQIKQSDPNHKFVTQKPFVSHKNLPIILKEADIFVFASSCETFGITLLEAMAVGIPIACSRRSSLPETLVDGGVYFSPEDPKDIARAIMFLIDNPMERLKYSKRARHLSRQYTWSQCSSETFSFISQLNKNVNE
jgi:glycosyltransferase involved in cell wall biosynthesis